MGKRVSIRRIGETESAQLAELLSEDQQLRSDLGFQSASDMSPEKIYRDIKNWESSKSAICYGVFCTELLAGMISLSHIDEENGTASVGYWIGSSFRRNGICSEAFLLVIEIARAIGLSSLTSKILKTNKASASIWIRQGARITELDAGKLRYELVLPKPES